MPSRESRQQRAIRRDIHSIFETLGFNAEYLDRLKGEHRTFALHQIRVTVIRGVVVEKYVMIDERMASLIAQYFFQRRNFIPLWRTKRFAAFNYYILEKLSLREKLTLLKTIRNVPRAVVDAVERINAARNIIAHNFFPENAREIRLKKKRRGAGLPIFYPYKGINVFTSAGVTLFLEDVEKVVEAVPYPRN